MVKALILKYKQFHFTYCLSLGMTTAVNVPEDSPGTFLSIILLLNGYLQAQVQQ